MVFRRKVEMNNKKTSSWNLGVKGYIIVILAFFSCYVYSALTSDSLNVTRDVFIGLGINQAAVYAMSTIAVPFGIIGSIIPLPPWDWLLHWPVVHLLFFWAVARWK